MSLPGPQPGSRGPRRVGRRLDLRRPASTGAASRPPCSLIARASDPRPRRREVDGAAFDLDHRGADDPLGGVRDDLLGQHHDVRVVDERLVELEHRELGVVTRAEALVAEDATDLEHLLVPADDEPLQVQLERDAQDELEVERVVVREERRPSRRPAAA